MSNTPLPAVPLVENFKCFEDQPKKCTWNPTQKLRIQYRSERIEFAIKCWFDALKE